MFVDELLAAFGSAESVWSDARVHDRRARAACGFTRATMVIVAELFSGSVLKATVTALPMFEQTPPEFAVHDCSVSEDGSVSMTRTLVAASGPEFDTLIV